MIGYSLKMKKNKGVCDYEKRKITLCKKKSHQDRLNTLLHEILHASQRDLDEEAIDEIAEAIEKGIKITTAAGYFYQ